MVVSRSRQTPPTPLLHAFSDATTRQLPADERQAIEKYVAELSHAQQVPASGATSAPVALALNEQSDTVYSVTRAITRYGITTDAPNKWRYFLDSVEVHLPPFWEQHINDENSVELIPTDSLPLVITLNGHSLSDYRRGSAKLRHGTRFGHPGLHSRRRERAGRVAADPSGNA